MEEGERRNRQSHKTAADEKRTRREEETEGHKSAQVIFEEEEEFVPCIKSPSSSLLSMAPARCPCQFGLGHKAIYLTYVKEAPAVIFSWKCHSA